MRFGWVLAAMLAGGAACADSVARDFARVMVRDMAEDLGLHVLGTLNCGLVASPHAEALGQRLRWLDAAAFEDGQHDAAEKYRALKRAASKATLCAGVKQAQPKALANIAAAMAAAEKMAPAADPPAPPAATLGPKSTGGDYVESAGPSRRAWHGKAAATVGEGATPGYADALGDCLGAMLTPANSAEKATVAALRKTELAFLTAMCASGLTTKRQ